MLVLSGADAVGAAADVVAAAANDVVAVAAADGDPLGADVVEVAP